MKQSRTRYTKSRAGCQTCRIRHVKCDETTPQCRRCVSTGRVCDGPRSADIIFYQPPKPRRQRVDSPARLLEISPLHWLDRHEERRAFALFLNLVSPVLSGALDFQCWSVLIPQLAQSSLIVRYGMFAMATFFEHPIRAVMDGNVTIHPIAERHFGGLTWHSKAISAARSQGHIMPTQLMIRSLIFATLEFQQNNFRAGLELLRIVFTVFAQLMTAGCDTIPEVPIDEAIETLLPMAMRSLCLLFSSLTDDWIHEPPAEDYVHRPSDLTIKDLETAVFIVMRTVYAFLKDSYFAIELESATQLRQLELVRLRLSFRAQALKDCLRQHHSNSGKRNALVEYCDICLSWLDLMESMFQSPYISAQGHLQRIFNHTQNLVLNGSTLYPTASSATFFFEMVVTPSAYLVALLVPPGPMREQSLKQTCRQPTACGVNPQLHAIVLSTGDVEFSSSELQSQNIARLFHGRTDQIWAMTKICDLDAWIGQSSTKAPM